MSKKNIMIIFLVIVLILSVLLICYFCAPTTKEKLQRGLEENFFISINDNIEVTEYEITDEYRLATLKISETHFADFSEKNFFTVPEEPTDEFFVNYKENGYYEMLDEEKRDILSINNDNLPTEKIANLYSAQGTSPEGWRGVCVIAYITKPESGYRTVYLRGN